MRGTHTIRFLVGALIITIVTGAFAAAVNTAAAYAFFGLLGAAANVYLLFREVDLLIIERMNQREACLTEDVNWGPNETDPDVQLGEDDETQSA